MYSNFNNQKNIKNSSIINKHKNTKINNIKNAYRFIYKTRRFVNNSLQIKTNLSVSCQNYFHSKYIKPIKDKYH